MDLIPFIVLTQAGEQLGMHAVAAPDAQNALSAISQQLVDNQAGDTLVVAILNENDIETLRQALDQTKMAIQLNTNK